MSLDRPQFAAEFLRRNLDYNKDYHSTQEQIASGALAHDAGMERLAHRWGLSFPACARHRCVGITRRLETGAYTICCYRCTRT